MKCEIQNLTGKNCYSIEVSDKLFSKQYNENLVHQVLNYYIAGSHTGVKNQKNRSQVSGGGIKPWRQKGTGRARAGSIRSPIFRKGGVTFASNSKVESSKIKINKKMYKSAICMIIQKLFLNNTIQIVNEIKIESKNTKYFLEIFKKIGLINNSLLLLAKEELEENIIFSSRNIKNLLVAEINKINPVNLLKYKKIIITENAIKQLEKILL